jgi:hypothetical protein
LLAKDNYKCLQCQILFKSENVHLDSTEEEKRYRFHENDANDPNYYDFLIKLLKPIEKDLDKIKTHLDFGSGKSSVYQKFFLERNCESLCYDLFFHPDKETLTRQYDLVTCSEVVEHFNNPSQDWAELVSVVKQNGLLAVMTNFYLDEIDYPNWWYKNDPTHVVFYSLESLKYIEKKYLLKNEYCDSKSIIIFRKL